MKKDFVGYIGSRIQHAMFRLDPHCSLTGPTEYPDSVGLDLDVAIRSCLLRELADDKRPQAANHRGKRNA